MQPLIALVDCNNFYVSCERVFRPDLIGKPVAVLSNNDGCIVARSQEVKALGINMAVPLFQVEDLIRQHQVQLFSSNYSLYTDMSDRVMTILEEFTPHLEIYSIDEAFLDLTGVVDCQRDRLIFGQKIRNTLRRQTGIPVCVGMGPTKTLAKLANHAAKHWQKTAGVVDLSECKLRHRVMRQLAVKNVWGVGSRTARKLAKMGVVSAYDLAVQPVKRIQAQFNIILARTVMELNGIPCLPLQEMASDKQQIICSRSFGRRLTQYHELSAALSEFSMRATEKLRQQQSMAARLSIFIRTNPFCSRDAQYQRTAVVPLRPATQDSRIISAQANVLLTEIYKPGYRYHKCGVQLSAIQPARHFDQGDLFYPDKTVSTQESHRLMQVMDQINQRYSKGISIASTRLAQHWMPDSERLSQRYTTAWDELVRVR
jgi:DNA polymerase V